MGRAPEGSGQLLFLFTTTCPYCRASLTGWNRIATDLADDTDVQVLGIAVDQGEEGVDVARYQATHGLRFPVLGFPHPKLEALYRARTVPLVVLLDADGQVLWSRVGALETQAAIDSVLVAVRAPANETLAEASRQASAER